MLLKNKLNLFKRYNKFSDEDLMVMIQKSDYAAFNELYNRYSKRLLHFMFKMLNNDDEKAQDLLQDLFMKIVERPHLFDSTKKFYSWIFTVAANMCRTHHRDNKVITVSADEFEVSRVKTTDELVSRIDAGMFSKHLNIALENLQYEHKETFLLRFQEGFSINEISEMMNCSLGTVKSRIYYTTRKLAMDLEEFKPLLKK